MPFTANRSFKKQPRIITRASGAYLEDAAGRRIFDGLSGLQAEIGVSGAEDERENEAEPDGFDCQLGWSLLMWRHSCRWYQGRLCALLA